MIIKDNCHFCNVKKDVQDYELHQEDDTLTFSGKVCEDCIERSENQRKKLTVK